MVDRSPHLALLAPSAKGAKPPKENGDSFWSVLLGAAGWQRFLSWHHTSVLLAFVIDLPVGSR